MDPFAIAARLRQAAEILQAQGANPFRVSAYRNAAHAVETHAGELCDLHARGGRAALAALPAIGHGLAAAIAEMLETGRWAQLERLRGSADPATLFRSVPGIGAELAVRIFETLGVETLEALEVACHDGRLASVAGIGPRRAAMIRTALAEILGRGRPVGTAHARPAEPAVDLLLDVDREYRDRAGKGELPRIAPRRFNPEHKPWLPVLHTTRAGWHFTALFSNTALAHELARTGDWVVLYFDSDHEGERQRTVVTETKGPMAGRRVVRGRESECELHYGAPRDRAA
jgi:hypothetical protein